MNPKAKVNAQMCIRRAESEIISNKGVFRQFDTEICSQFHLFLILASDVCDLTSFIDFFLSFLSFFAEQFTISLRQNKNQELIRWKL